jgi:uncharacterized protein (TIGR00369 family)
MVGRLDQLRKVVNGEADMPPVAKLIGFRLVEVEEGRAVVHFEAEPRHWNPQGTLHGGIFCDVADAAMGIAYLTQLEDSVGFTTVELKINFLRPVRTGLVVATGYVVKSGRTLGLTECDMHDTEGKLVARASSTCMTLR